MLDTFGRLAAGVVELMVLIWALTSLAEVKRSQTKILRELANLKGSQNG